MARSLDYGYLLTPTGLLNVAEILCLIGALIDVGFTSRLYCELADNLNWIYPGFSTLLVRCIFQAFAVFCLTVTIVIFIIHIYGIRFLGGNFYYTNQLCIFINFFMGLMMLSIGICAAFWEDKLRRTPGIIQRGYYSNQYQFLYDEPTHPRPGTAAIAAILGILVGLLFMVEACTRPMLHRSVESTPTYYAAPVSFRRVPMKILQGERVMPVEATIAYYPNTRT